MNKILISSCFLGAPVRYNGTVKKLIHPLIELWQQQGRLLAICPEVAGGLSTPRAAAEIQPNSQLIITTEGHDVSNSFHQGANIALTLCQKHNIQLALLKESSPSCGSSLIYDGSFSNEKINGAGITTQLLRKHGIQVFSELSISALADCLDQ